VLSGVTDTYIATYFVKDVDVEHMEVVVNFAFVDAHQVAKANKFLPCHMCCSSTSRNEFEHSIQM